MKSLKDIYKDYFKIGAAINEETIVSCKDLILSQFNSVTCENAMKYGRVCNRENEYNFEIADRIHGFAKENNIPMRGHCFVWHQEIPTEKFAHKAPADLLSRISEHMRIMALRYPDLYAWDVLNEAIDDKHGLYLRDTVWLKVLGEDYITKIFTAARKSTDGVPLFYNDYNECDDNKRGKIIKLVSGLKEKGLVDGLGLQCHLNVNLNTAEQMRRSLDEYSKLGLRLQVTELDVSMINYEDHTLYEKPTAEMIEKQAALYDGVFAAFREYHDIIDSVTFWCVSDENSWLNYFPIDHKNWPLLFDENHKPKEAFNRIIQF